jgi:K+-sensing histidine kinase KdpD
MRNSVRPIVLTLALVALTTLLYFAVDFYGLLNFVPVIYMVPVVVAATRWGTLPALVASIAGTLASDYFFFPPYYSFAIADPHEVVNLLLFLFVALVVSNLAARLKNEADILRAREKEILDLYALSRRLAACSTVPDLISSIQDFLSTTLDRRTVFIAGPPDSELESDGLRSLPESIRQEVSTIAGSKASQSRTVVEPVTRHAWLIAPVSSGSADHGSVAIDLGVGSSKAIESIERRAEMVVSEAIARIKQIDVANAMNQARLRLQAEHLKEALMGAVSHDLRTPLTSILGSVSVLEQFPSVRNDDRVHSLIEAVHDEAKQLDTDIKNLLNATRITKQGIRPRLEWTDPADIINAAIKGKSRLLAAHRVTVDVARDLPLVKVDATLIEDALGQLLGNAAKYSKIDSTIKVSARAQQDSVVLSVCDEGAGLTPEEARQLYQQGFRSPRHVASIPGSGLGLWIANTFVTANGGTLEATSGGVGLGTMASIRLPAGLGQRSDLAVTTYG